MNRHLALFLSITVLGCTDVSRRSTIGEQEPAWLQGLPSSSQQFELGEAVLAAVPRTGLRLDVLQLKVVSQTGDVVTLVDDIGNIHADVPTFLVHRRERKDNRSIGEAVVADRWNAHHLVGRVVEPKLESSASTSASDPKWQIAYDWNGETVVEAFDSVLSYSPTSTLAWVRYRDEQGSVRKGLRFAADSDTSWVREDGGSVRLIPTADVSEFSPAAIDTLEVGTAVSAYLWKQGFVTGEVREIMEENLRYRVDLTTGETVDLFFENLSLPDEAG